MADEGYNLHSELRSISGMGTVVPTDAVITHWVNMIDGMIERYVASPDDEIARMIEANRVSVLYWNLKHDSDKNEMKAAIAPLSTDEKEMLSNDDEDSGVDAISMNGKRRTEIFGGRR